MSLPYDIARCPGYAADGEWRDGCEDCQRRTQPGHPYWQSTIQPPAIVVFECDSRIPPDSECK